MDKRTQNMIIVATIVGTVVFAMVFLTCFTGTTTCIPATKENGRFDVDNDGIVNFQDSGLIWIHRTVDENGTSTGEPYDMTYDMDCNGDVDQDDGVLCWDNRD